ncbi:hypothetical protein FRC14_003472 [Serendipita sp. 396]|nr:hypothetical protein FRC14_003472 [Serendipita sp. 396]KAG8803345.1 hypothetical protein FRC16_006090 [Serendipita sp. 398]KAG8876217.1 hypothetical protein FRC20_002189 [Serendipita sp. 405]KAG9053974.1 hypothetical protein FS842_006583 [Serendipita sp. 407]
MPPTVKKQRPKNAIVYSQPKDTHQGKNENTQIHLAVTFLKESPGMTLNLQDLSILADVPMIMEEGAAEKLRAHPKIQFHPATNLYSYKAEVVVDSKDAIVAEMQRHGKKGVGVSVKNLKESWKGSVDAILELEAEGKVIVIRSGKDKAPKYVFWNTISSEQKEQQAVDQEFKDMWLNQRVPEDADILRSLNSEGFAPTTSQAMAAKPAQKKKARKVNRPRPMKITNTHIQGVDLSVDYQAPG